MSWNKPAALRTGKTGKKEIAERTAAEEKLKGNTTISQEAPTGLSINGKRLYEEIIELLPEGFLNAGDTYIVGIVADALDRMQTAQEVLNREGLLTEEGSERDASKSYERYSKIYDKFGSKLGLSPKDRAAIAALNLKEKDVDPLLAILNEDD